MLDIKCDEPVYYVNYTDICKVRVRMWTILDHRGPLWTIVDHCGPLWTIVDHCGPSWTTVDHCGPLWTTVDHSSGCVTIALRSYKYTQ